MLVIFQSILPIFLVMALGALLRRAPLIDASAWPGLDQLCYWFLYPVLLFTSILGADFSALALDRVMLALLSAIAVMIVGVGAAWPLLRRSGAVAESQFSSVYQTSIRWNGFIALAVAQKIYPPEGAAVVALVMAVVIVPLNIASTYVVASFADRSASFAAILRMIATNPFIISVLGAIVFRQFDLALPATVATTLDLIGRAAIGVGLLAIGAGLRPGDLTRQSPALWLPVFLKLILFPTLLVGLALTWGVEGNALLYLALCGSVPTAMNGYALARMLGGDAPLYAAIATLQTVFAFLTMPLVLWSVAYLISG